MVCLSRPYPFKFFRGCLTQNLHSPLCNTLSQMIHSPEWDIVIYEKSSFHELCTSCFISQRAAGFKILMSFTFYMKFNHNQLGVYFNSASFTVSFVCSCLNPFLKFFVKQSFTSKLLMIAFKLSHRRFC